MSWLRIHGFSVALLGAYLVLWGLLAIEPLSRSDWVLENLLVALTLPLLVFFHRRTGISRASDLLLFIFYSLHAIGGHWSYSNVPLPWAEWGFERNHFDRVVHLTFGLLLWLPVRDALSRFARLGSVWAGFFALTAIMAASGFYEVIEWGAVAVVAPDLGQEFLGAQGDEFDASKDMGLATLGAVAAFGTERLVVWLRDPGPALAAKGLQPARQAPSPKPSANGLGLPSRTETGAGPRKPI